MLDNTLERLAAVAGDPGATFMDAALAVTRCIDESLDLGPVDRALAALVGGHDGEEAPWAYLRRLGFGRRSPDDVVAGSRMDRLLETRRGLPITLAALLAHVAEAAGHRARGINFPGHFLLRINQTLIDPFALTPRTEAECLATLPADGQREDPFVETETRDVLLRMFNNLKYFHVSRAEYHRALDMLDCQLCVLPGHPGLIFEQGEYWLRLGSVLGARQAYERILEGEVSSRDDSVVDMARQRLAELADRRDTLH